VRSEQGLNPKCTALEASTLTITPLMHSQASSQETNNL